MFPLSDDLFVPISITYPLFDDFPNCKPQPIQVLPNPSHSSQLSEHLKKNRPTWQTGGSDGTWGPDDIGEAESLATANKVTILLYITLYII